MKKFVLKSLCLLPIPVLIAAVNYSVDPAHVFDAEHTFEKGVARLLLDNFNVANVANCDDRFIQKFYIEGLTKPKDVVIVGSSRSMQVQQEYFGGAAVFNNSVSKGTLEDYLAIYELYHRRGLKPRVFVLGLDPWILNDNNTVRSWRSLEREVNATRSRMGIAGADDVVGGTVGATCRKGLELLSLSYFQASVAELWRTVRRDASRSQGYYATEATDGDTYIKLADGSLRYNRAYQTRSTAEVGEDALSYAKRPPTEYYADFTELSPRRMRELETFVDLLGKDGVSVVFFLPPYHPVAYEGLTASKRTSFIVDTQKYFCALAARKGILVLGSYDPRTCSCDGGDFLDAHHPKMSCLSKIRWPEAVRAAQ